MKAPASLAVVVLVMAFLAMGATDPDLSREDSIAALKDRVSSLEQRVRTLESKLPSTTARPRSATGRPARPPRSPSRPNGWRRKEFNGIPYYIIPVERQPGKSTRRPR